MTETSTFDSLATRRLRMQYAALPFRMVGGFPQIMLVTSRQTRRWVLPKGWPQKGLAPWDLAAREAYEEAGLVGRIEEVPIGRYTYLKWLDDRTPVPCEVEVFALHVEQQLDDWPERRERETRWFTPGQAAMQVEEGGLVHLLLGFGAAQD